MAGAWEIGRLPEDVLSAVISLTSPRDACRVATVSRSFRAAADSDTAWSRFLPRDGLPPLAAGDLSRAPPSKKALFLRLSDRPVLLSDNLTCMWLEKGTGGKCFMLSPRKLLISWINTPHYWRLIPFKDDPRFSEGFVAELVGIIGWLEIRGKIPSTILSKKTNYAAYLVFKTTCYSRGMGSLKEASVSIGGVRISTCQVCLKTYDCEGEQDEDDCEEVPQERIDGWMEVELGEFFNDQGEDGDVSIGLFETRWSKSGLIVLGIEIRPKHLS